MAAPSGPAAVTTRWWKTPTTFGPVIRVASSLAIVAAIVAGYSLVAVAVWTYWTVPSFARVSPGSDGLTTGASPVWYLMLIIPFSLAALAMVWRRGTLPAASGIPPTWGSGGKLGPLTKVALSAVVLLAPIFFLPKTLRNLAVIPASLIVIGLWMAPTREQ